MSSIVWRYSSRSRSRSRFGAARSSFSGGNTQPDASRAASGTAGRAAERRASSPSAPAARRAGAPVVGRRLADRELSRARLLLHAQRRDGRDVDDVGFRLGFLFRRPAGSSWALSRCFLTTSRRCRSRFASSRRRRRSRTKPRHHPEARTRAREALAERQGRREKEADQEPRDEQDRGAGRIQGRDEGRADEVAHESARVEAAPEGLRACRARGARAARP